MPVHTGTLCSNLRVSLWGLPSGGGYFGRSSVFSERSARLGHRRVYLLLKPVDSGRFESTATTSITPLRLRSTVVASRPLAPRGGPLASALVRIILGAVRRPYRSAPATGSFLRHAASLAPDAHFPDSTVGCGVGVLLSSCLFAFCLAALMPFWGLFRLLVSFAYALQQ